MPLQFLVFACSMCIRPCGKCFQSRLRHICWNRTPDTRCTRPQLKEEERGGGGVISRLTGSLQSWMMNFIQAHGFGGILLLVRPGPAGSHASMHTQ